MGDLDLPGQIYWLSESSFCEDGELTLSGLCWLRTVCEFFFFHLQVFPSFLPVICLYHKIETEKHTICEILGQQSPTLDTKTGGGWARRWTQWARRRAGRPGQSLPLLDQPSPSSRPSWPLWSRPAPSLRFILMLSRCLWEMAANSQNRSCPTGPVALSFVPSEKGTPWVD